MAFLLTGIIRAIGVWLVTPTGEEVFILAAIRDRLPEGLIPEGLIPQGPGDEEEDDMVNETPSLVEWYAEPILPA